VEYRVALCAQPTQQPICMKLRPIEIGRGTSILGGLLTHALPLECGDAAMWM
jgi:hypothetical protein